MSKEKVFTLSDEDGNLYTVKDWDELIEAVTKQDLEDLYVVTKYMYSFEEAMIELEGEGKIKPITEGGAPLENMANSLDRIMVEIGVERTKELDERVKKLLSEKTNKIDPSSFIHLN